MNVIQNIQDTQVIKQQKDAAAKEKLLIASLMTTLSTILEDVPTNGKKGEPNPTSSREGLAKTILTENSPLLDKNFPNEFADKVMNHLRSNGDLGSTGPTHKSSGNQFETEALMMMLEEKLIESNKNQNSSIAKSRH